MQDKNFSIGSTDSSVKQQALALAWEKCPSLELKQSKAMTTLTANVQFN